MPASDPERLNGPPVTVLPSATFLSAKLAVPPTRLTVSPPTVSDWVLERYGQNVTESESMIPDGQFASASGVPFTGFSGIGGLTVPPGLVVFSHTAGPGVGSGIAAEVEPTRSPQ